MWKTSNVCLHPKEQPCNLWKFQVYLTRFQCRHFFRFHFQHISLHSSNRPTESEKPRNFNRCCQGSVYFVNINLLNHSQHLVQETTAALIWETPHITSAERKSNSRGVPAPYHQMDLFPEAISLDHFCLIIGAIFRVNLITHVAFCQRIFSFEPSEVAGASHVLWTGAAYHHWQVCVVACHAASVKPKKPSGSVNIWHTPALMEADNSQPRTFSFQIFMKSQNVSVTF